MKNTTKYDMKMCLWDLPEFLFMTAIEVSWKYAESTGGKEFLVVILKIFIFFSSNALKVCHSILKPVVLD